MADGKAVLSQQGRRLYDIPCCMAPLSLLQHPVVHGLNAEFYTGQAIGLKFVTMASVMQSGRVEQRIP